MIILLIETAKTTRTPRENLALSLIIRVASFFANSGIGKYLVLDRQKAQVQLGVPQVDIYPLLMRVRSFHRGLLRHPFAPADAIDLPSQRGGRLLQRYLRRLQCGGLGRIAESRTKSQPNHPAPRQ